MENGSEMEKAKLFTFRKHILDFRLNELKKSYTKFSIKELWMVQNGLDNYYFKRVKRYKNAIDKLENKIITPPASD
jgi:hypothetical protein